MNNFWNKLHRPFFALAPMDDVTDIVFRSVVNDVARPDIFFTEFVNVEGLSSKGQEILKRRLLFSSNQHPIVAQIWGKEPENYYRSALLIKELGFDGVDINMGCPDKKVVKIGSCSALINNRSLAQEIIQATKEGSGGLPVSVKTRIGFNTIQTEEWIGFLLNQNLEALTVHGRTVKELSEVPAHWDEIGKSVILRDNLRVKTLIVGNGDVIDRKDGLIKASKYKVDGIMIGRGIFKNIYAFSSNGHFSNKEQLEILLKHTKLFTETWGKNKNFAIMKKFFKIYTLGIDDASFLRKQLMSTKSYNEVKNIIDDYILAHYS